MHISKYHEISYGHRVHNQVLDEWRSCYSECKCRHLHGHNGRIKVILDTQSMEGRDVVIDFNEFNRFFKHLDILDHHFVLDVNDPMIENLGLTQAIENLEETELTGFYRTKLPGNNPKELEYLESFIFCNFVPTSENLCVAIQKAAKLYFPFGGEVKISIEFSETTKTNAAYSE